MAGGRLRSLAIRFSQAGERACLERNWRSSGAMVLHSVGSGTGGLRGCWEGRLIAESRSGGKGGEASKVESGALCRLDSSMSYSKVSYTSGGVILCC